MACCAAQYQHAWQGMCQTSMGQGSLTPKMSQATQAGGYVTSHRLPVWRRTGAGKTALALDTPHDTSQQHELQVT